MTRGERGAAGAGAGRDGERRDSGGDADHHQRRHDRDGDRTRSVLHRGAIVVDGERIVAVGPSADMVARYPHAQVIEGSGKAVFPGLINCHTHLCLTSSRGIQEDFGFPSTLRFPVTVQAMLSREENAVFAVLGALEALRSGTTALLEIGRGTDAYSDALATTGLRLVLADTASDLDPARVPAGRFEYVPSLREAALQRTSDLISRWHGAAGGVSAAWWRPTRPRPARPSSCARRGPSPSGRTSDTRST